MLGSAFSPKPQLDSYHCHSSHPILLNIKHRIADSMAPVISYITDL